MEPIKKTPQPTTPAAAERELNELAALMEEAVATSKLEWECRRTLIQFDVRLKQWAPLLAPDLQKKYTTLFKKAVDRYDKKFHQGDDLLNALEEKKTAAYKTFLANLSEVRLFHLVCDSYGRGMTKVGSDEELEGNSFYDSILFLQAGLNYLLIAHPNEFKGLEERITEFNALLDKMRPYAKKTQFKSRTLEAAKTTLDTLRADLEKDLEALKVGEKLLLPWGWGHPKAGHAMLLLFEKRENGLSIIVFNTGAGIGEYHVLAEGIKPFTNTIRGYFVPPHLHTQFTTETLPKLFEPNILGSCLEFDTLKTRPYYASELYEMLTPYSTLPQGYVSSAFSYFTRQPFPLIEQWMKMQGSGTCSFRVLLALYGALVGNPKEFKTLFEVEAIHALVGMLEEGSLSKTFEMILSNAIPKLFGRLEKPSHITNNREIKNRLEIDKERFLLCRSPIESTRKDVELPKEQLPGVEIDWPEVRPPEDNVSATLSDSKKQDSWYSYTEKMPTSFSPIPPLDRLTVNQMKKMLSEITAPRPITKHLDPDVKEVSPESLYYKRFCQQTLCALGRFFVDPAYSTAKADFLNELRKIKGAGEILGSISHFVNLNSPDQLPDPARFVTIAYTQAIVKELATLLDDEMGFVGDARLDHYTLMDELSLKEYNLLLDPTLERDLTLLNNYISNEAVKGRPLFPTESFDPSDPKTAAYAYANAHIERISFERNYSNPHEKQLREKIIKEVGDLQVAKRALLFLPEEHLDENFTKHFPQFHFLYCLHQLHRRCHPYLGYRDFSRYQYTILHHPEPSIVIHYYPLGEGPRKKIPLEQRFNESEKHLATAKKDAFFLGNDVPRRDAQNKLLLEEKSGAELTKVAATRILFTQWMDYWKENPRELAKEEATNKSLGVLFEPFLLRRGLQEYPELQQELLSACDEMITNVAGIEADLDDETRKKSPPFYVAYLQKVLLLNYFLDEGMSATLLEKMRETREAIKQKIETARIEQNWNEEGLFCVLLVLTYASYPELPEKEARELFSHLLQKRSFLNQISDKIVPLIHDTLTKQAPALKKVFETMSNSERQTRLAEVFPSSLPKLVWVSEDFPLLLAKNGTDFYTYDLFTQESRINGKAPSGIGRYRERENVDQLFWRLVKRGFSKKKYFDGITYTVSDGHFICKTNVLVKINNIPYEDAYVTSPSGEKYRLLLDFSLPSWMKFPGAGHYTYGTATGEEEPMALCPLANNQIVEIYEPRTGKLLATQQKNGTWEIHGDPFGPFREVEVEKVKEYFPEIPSYAPFILLQSTQDPGKIRLLLPEAVDERKEPIVFESSSSSGQLTLKSRPDWFLAKEQRVAGIQGLVCFLVLENSKGEKEVLLQKDKNVRAWNESFPLEKHHLLASFKMEGDEIAIQAEYDKNLFLANIFNNLATTPEEYLRTYHFLQGGVKFGPYLDEDLYALASILFNPIWEETNHPEGAALSLHTLLLLKRHFQNFPEAKPNYPKSEDPHRHSYETDSKRLIFKATAMCDYAEHPNLRTLRDLYLKGERHVQQPLKLERQATAAEMASMGFQPSYKISPRQTAAIPKFLEFLVVYNEKEKKINIPSRITFDFVKRVKEEPEQNQIAAFPPFNTRLGPDCIKYFHFLLQIAKNGTKEEKQKLLALLKNYHYDTDKDVQEIRFCLGANLLPKMWVHIPGLAERLDEVLNSPSSTVQTASISDELSQFITPPTEWGRPSGAPPAHIARREDKLFTAATKRALPKEPQKPDLHYQLQLSPFKDLNDLVEEHFNPVEDLSPPTNILQYQTTDSRLQEAISRFNNDYAVGYARNHKTFVPKKDLQATKNHLLADLKREETLVETYQEALKVLKKRIVSLANQSTFSDPRLRHQAHGLQRKVLNFADCRLLFLQRSKEKIKRVTDLQREEDIDRFFMEVGQALEMSVAINHRLSLLNQMKALRTAEEKDLPLLLTQIAKLLSRDHNVTKSLFPVELLTFEEVTGVMLFPAQVEKSNELFTRKDGVHFADIFVQQIQAGGKSFFFNRTFAEVKADGYHLSMHVAPSAERSSTLSDMARQIEEYAGQKMNVFEFDDHPSHFTLDYLTHLREMVENAIHNRDVINTSIEALRAFRCKYIKVALNTLQNTLLGGNELFELQQKIDKMEEILTLFRTRGVFTWDEIHIAMDPFNELNMPFGPTEPPHPIQTELLGNVIYLAAIEKNLRLKENKQALQSKEDFTTMCNRIVDTLLDDPRWQKMLGLRKYEEIFLSGEEEALLKAKPLLKDYFLNEKAELPIQPKSNKARGELAPSDYATLLHQLFAGKWLETALKQGVEEDCGIDYTLSPPVAIPFTANRTPAPGSEFSDTITMTSNTFISYQVQGLVPKQIKPLLALSKALALNEMNDNPTLYHDILTTPLAKSLEKLLPGYTLFTLKNANEEELVKALRMSDDPQIIQLINAFVEAEVLPKVKLYTKQVSTGAHETITMAHTATGYSGTMVNDLMGPVMGLERDAVKLSRDVGTTGQTVDVLFNRENRIFLVGDALIDEVIQKLTPDELARFRLLIDIGCHYRGIANEEVAKYLANVLPPQIKGILFHNEKTKRLCFYSRSTGAISILTSVKKIEEETACKADERFTFIGNGQFTGTDIYNLPDTLAVSIISEKSELFKVIQGDNRARFLLACQQLITALSNPSWQIIRERIGQKEKAPTPQDLLLHATIKENELSQNENLPHILFTLHNLATQFLLDQIYQKKLTRDKVFLTCNSLFERDLTVDLTALYGLTKTVLIKQFLVSYGERILQQVKPLLTKSDYAKMESRFAKEILRALPLQKKEVSVSASFEESSKMEFKITPESMGTQTRLQEQQQENVGQDKREAEAVSKFLQNKSKGEDAHSEIPTQKEHFTSPHFGEANKTDLGPKMVSLGSLYQSELKAKVPLFDPNILVTDNFAMTNANQIDLFGEWAKKPHQILAISDQKGGKRSWKVVLCSIHDGEQYAEYLMQVKKGALKLPEGRSMWLIKPFGGLAWASPFPLNPLEEEAIKLLQVQVLFFAADTASLRTKKWLPFLTRWQEGLEGDARSACKVYFEKTMLSELKVTNPNHPLILLFSS